MKTRSATRRAAALLRSFPSLPTEIWLEICGYLSYRQLVAVIGRLSRYHRELLVSPSLGLRLFRKAISKEDERFLRWPDQKAMTSHPLMSKIVWRGGRDDLYLARDKTTPVTASQIPVLSEFATLPPVVSLTVRLYSRTGDGIFSPYMLVRRSTGVTVKDIIAVIRNYPFTRSTTDDPRYWGYCLEEINITPCDKTFCNKRKTVTFSSYASIDNRRPNAKIALQLFLR